MLCRRCLAANLLLFHLHVTCTNSANSLSAHPFSVVVRCSVSAMELFVQFPEPFHGRLKTRPNGLCAVTGRGRTRVGFRLPLDSEHRQRCGIIRRPTEHVAIVDLEMNLRVITAEDNAYFVRCPVDPEGEDNHPPELRASTATPATPASRELRVWHGPEAEQQLLRLGIEHARDRAGVRMRMCVVFAPSAADAQGRVQALQISDEDGCPVPPGGQFFGHQLQFRPPNIPADPGGSTQLQERFVVQCEVVMNRAGGEQLGVDGQDKPCPAQLSSSSSAIPPSLHFLRHRRPLSGNNGSSPSSPPLPSSSSSSSSSSSLDHLYLITIPGSLLLVLCAIGFLCLALWHCPRAKRRKLKQNNHPHLPPLHHHHHPSNRQTIQIATQRHMSMSSEEALSMRSPSVEVRSSPSPLADTHENRRNNVPLDAMSSPEAMLSGTEAEERELASSLDRLPEPPSLSLAEVRQLNAAFNGLRECDDQRVVYSFAGIRLNQSQLSWKPTCFVGDVSPPLTPVRKPDAILTQPSCVKKAASPPLMPLRKPDTPSLEERSGNARPPEANPRRTLTSQQRFAQLLRQWNGGLMATKGSDQVGPIRRDRTPIND